MTYFYFILAKKRYLQVTTPDIANSCSESILRNPEDIDRPPGAFPTPRRSLGEYLRDMVGVLILSMSISMFHQSLCGCRVGRANTLGISSSYQPQSPSAVTKNLRSNLATCTASMLGVHGIHVALPSNAPASPPPPPSPSLPLAVLASPNIHPGHCYIFQMHGLITFSTLILVSAK